MHRWMTSLAVLALAAGAATLAVPVSAQAAGTPQWAWQTAPSPSFTSVVVGGTESRSYTLMNTSGSATASIKVTLSSSTTAFRITADGCTGTSLGNKKTCAVSITYSPTEAGSTGATLTATAKKPAAPAIMQLSGTPLNRAPVAVDDFYSTNEDTPLTISAPGVLANDYDPDGDAISVSVYAAGTTPGGYLPLAGEDGSFTFLPNPNFTGTATFIYALRAGGQGSNFATITITVSPVNDAPGAP